MDDVIHGATRPRPAARILGVAAALALAASTAAAQAVHPLAGSARFQVGAGLPLPITTAASPNGRVLATPAATAMQTSGPDPRRLTLSPSQLTAAAAPMNVGFALVNPNVFQIHTSVSVRLPNAPAVFRAGGRTGPATVTFCPGQVVGTVNPACASPAAPGNVINGLIRYTRTSNQFGGPAQAAMGGVVDSALRAGSFAPCHFASATGCIAVFASAAPLPAAMQGAPFGSFAVAPGSAPSPGLFAVGVSPGGVITSITSAGLGSGVANPQTSFGGPWTTGMVTVSVTGPLGLQVFTLTGSDNRVSGVGSLSLVSGSVSARGLTGPNANRGWLNLVLGPAAAGAPSASPAGIAAIAGLLALVGARRLYARALRS